jgi:hypothetical protein
MHGNMSGYYEMRLTGPGRVQHRLFCILDNADAQGLKKADSRSARSPSSTA